MTINVGINGFGRIGRMAFRAIAKDFPNIEFEGPASVIGRAVIIHANADDLITQPSGNAGGRVACGVINQIIK